MKIPLEDIRVNPGRRELDGTHVRELDEIDENFVRTDLSALELGQADATYA